MTVVLPQRSGRAFPCPIAQGRHPAGKKTAFHRWDTDGGQLRLPRRLFAFFRRLGGTMVASAGRRMHQKSHFGLLFLKCSLHNLVLSLPECSFSGLRFFGILNRIQIFVDLHIQYLGSLQRFYH
ncbi:MAG: hypothetical protein LUG15_02565 [Oscillospiraceae bacterium]|nr:hypothetical protein [Oscillospiraceae bacterium]